VGRPDWACAPSCAEAVLACSVGGKILKKYLTQNGIYVWCITCRVLLSERIFSLLEAVSMYGLQHSEFALGKKKIAYPEQFLCIVYDILSIAKILLSFSLCNIV